MAANATMDIDALWDFADPAISEVRFRDALPRARELGSLCEAELLTQIARAQGLQRKFEEALATLEEARSCTANTDPATANSQRVRVRILLEHGRVLNSGGDPAAATPLFEEAFRLGELKPDVLTADAAHMLGIVVPGSDGRAWNERALGIARTSKDPAARKWLGPVHNNIGWSLHDGGEFTAALRHFEEALHFHQSGGKEPQIRIARWTVARCLRSMSRIEEALQIQLALETECEHAREPDDYVFEEITECCAARGESERASIYAAKALELFETTVEFAQSEPQRHARLKALKDTGGIRPLGG